MAKRVVMVLAAGVLLGLSFAGYRHVQHRDAEKEETAFLNECPETDDAWVKWREQALKALLKVERPATCEYLDWRCPEGLIPEVITRQSKQIADQLDQCARKPEGVPEHLVGNLRAFTSTQRNAARDTDNPRLSENQFGHGPGINDHQYLDAIKDITALPPLLASERFLQSIGNPKTYHAAWKMIQDHNCPPPAGKCLPEEQWWKTLIFRSRFLPTPDDALVMGRFFVMVPGDKQAGGVEHDRWIQFGIWLPDDKDGEKKDPPRISNVSVVAVAPANKPGEPARFDALLDRWRVYKDNGEIEVRTRREVQGVSENCQDCHKVVPLGIHPQTVYTFNADGVLGALKDNDVNAHETPNWLNQRIRERYARPPRYAISTADTFASARNFGPALGPVEEHDASPEMVQARQQCVKGHGLQSSVDKVVAQMQCARCHSKRFGMLNYPQATRSARVASVLEGPAPNHIYAYIKNGWMPVENNGQAIALQPEEREALFDCLQKEYFNAESGSGIFVDWLRQSYPAKKPGDTPVAPSNTLTTSPQTRLVLSQGQPQSPLFAEPAASPASAADSTDYDKRCLECHAKTADSNGEGPGLLGIYMNFAASRAGFPYSEGMGEVGLKRLVWDEANLMEFLKDPNQFLQGKLGHPAESDMLKRFPDEALRRRIVQYLMTLK